MKSGILRQLNSHVLTVLWHALLLTQLIILHKANDTNWSTFSSLVQIINLILADYMCKKFLIKFKNLFLLKTTTNESAVYSFSSANKWTINDS